MTTPIELQPYGPDISNHNGTVNFLKVKAAGASFCFIKRSQGTGFIDGKGRNNVLLAESAKLVVGQYHYLDYQYPGAAQARFFINLVGKPGPGRLPHTVDIENDTDDSNPRQYTRAEMMTCADDFIEEYNRLTNAYPMIYTYPYFWRDVLGNPNNFSTECPLWIADYSHKKPTLVGGWPYHTFHQYTSSGKLAGVSGDVDMNRFNGSLERLKVLAGI